MKADTLSAGNSSKPIIVQKNDGQNFFVGSLPLPKIILKNDGKTFRWCFHKPQQFQKLTVKHCCW